MVNALPRLKRRVVVSLADEDGRSADGIEVWSFATFSRELESGTLLP